MFATFGFREMSWPRGDGYLYFCVSPQSEEKPFIFLDLYKTSDAEFERLLREKLPLVLDKLSCANYKTENMSEAAQKIFAVVAADLGLASRQ